MHLSTRYKRWISHQASCLSFALKILEMIVRLLGENGVVMLSITQIGHGLEIPAETTKISRLELNSLGGCVLVAADFARSYVMVTQRRSSVAAAIPTPRRMFAFVPSRSMLNVVGVAQIVHRHIAVKGSAS